jgi:hypothetical protein
MRLGPSDKLMVIDRSGCDEDSDSASSRFEASICSRRRYLHPELLTPATPDSFTLALINWRERPRSRADIVGARADQFVVGALLLDVCRPAADAG